MKGFRVNAKSHARHAALCTILVAAALGAAGCGSSSDSASSAPPLSSPSSTSAQTPASKPAASLPGDTVTIKNFAFGSPITVKAGAVVTVHNADGTTHSLAADAGSFDAGNVFAGTSKSFVAPMTAGTYKFHCNFHSNMHGTLIVTG
ncbi:MAG: hypothetical protein QOI44_2661 [Actinomycetota bacterium]|nr:hypothetical protein [Actinomycetota bacterium]